ncbi:DHA2 family efflux MFS transporter permease subunit [Phyllobacterium sp. BT25]|uniref:DHA2 family efflux MFS transporter permease subunit n=1 Tax=Phyllobacterium pellucidum TaxID=2740464 RepID=A0A849VSE1_9HYPH|nr:DHA2 family efflux MFS transporter permease subunit [Phyllobacterium pellucidum]NTS32928.1 DHA2 family efflux MFS transporter permease subunit [Phyllobacterium pellucidum]
MSTHARSIAAATASTWFGFAALCIGMFMAILDVQIVSTSLPNIQNALDIDPDQMSWIQTAYLIAEVVAIPLNGFLTRTLTMRWLFVCGIILFTLASVGCALSGDFSELLAWRILQGLAGGALIPLIFSAVFILFPGNLQGIATTAAGVVAVMAPTVGPMVGGWITEAYSWHWLFLINVIPGIVAAGLAATLLPREATKFQEIRTLDVMSLLMMAIGLAAMEIGLKEAPKRGWTDGIVLGLAVVSAATLAGFVRRTWRNKVPLVNLRNFKELNFTIGCALSFILGFGLFGSVYLMPLFLAYVRGHSAFTIGTMMLATGVAQILVAPIAVFLEQRMDARVLTAIGYAVFAIGLGCSAFQTPATDGDGMFWPQIIRGVAIMFCILPPTRLALGNLPHHRIPDASGLFNLMRNLGGALSLALIDTVIYSRAATHGLELANGLLIGDAKTAAFVGIPLDQLRGDSMAGAGAELMFSPLVAKAALVQSINDAWAMIALITLVSLIVVPFARPIKRDPHGVAT